jgi:hypothetical protein
VGGNGVTWLCPTCAGGGAQTFNIISTEPPRSGLAATAPPPEVKV